MAKNNERNGTPIQFEDPKWSTKGSRVPIPINQPNWVYKRESNSNPSAVIWGILVIPIALGIFLIFQSMDDSPLWLVVILFVFGIVVYGLSESKDHKAQKGEEDNSNQPKKRAKKVPKRRKDYK